MPRNVAILIFDDVEVLDFAGPFEIFSVCGLRNGGEKPFNVYLVAERAELVRARNNFPVMPHYTLDDCPQPDLIVVPGGYGTRREMNNPVVLDWVRRMDQTTELTLSVCTGAFVLAKAGLLTGKRATTHFMSLDTLPTLAPEITVERGVRYVDEGRLITSAGVQAGMDMSLHVIARLLGEPAARETAEYIEYLWMP